MMMTGEVKCLRILGRFFVANVITYRDCFKINCYIILSSLLLMCMRVELIDATAGGCHGMYLRQEAELVKCFNHNFKEGG